MAKVHLGLVEGFDDFGGKCRGELVHK